MADLVPVFMPPLATLLGSEESARGRALTAEEVLAIRDRAICMTMSADRARALEVSRGYRDVVASDCWADWHRLRVQITGRGYLPKIVLCAIGSARFAKRAEAVLRAEGIEHETRGADARMSAAFAASAFRPAPCLGEPDHEAIGGHARVVYALSENFVAGAAADVGRRFLALGARLLDECEADALKCESSGIAHGKACWKELGEIARSSDGADVSAALVRAFVQMPIGGGADELWTCGMHLLGRPDLVARRAEIGSAEDAVRLFEALARYLVGECGSGRRHFASGNTFAADERSTRCRATWEPCRGYEEDEFFFNPFGRFRLGAL
jgi:hypothetical protein